jgi:hypothetical protein
MLELHPAGESQDRQVTGLPGIHQGRLERILTYMIPILREKHPTFNLAMIPERAIIEIVGQIEVWQRHERDGQFVQHRDEVESSQQPAAGVTPTFSRCTNWFIRQVARHPRRVRCADVFVSSHGMTVERVRTTGDSPDALQLHHTNDLLPRRRQSVPLTITTGGVSPIRPCHRAVAVVARYAIARRTAGGTGASFPFMARQRISLSSKSSIRSYSSKSIFIDLSAP